MKHSLVLQEIVKSEQLYNYIISDYKDINPLFNNSGLFPVIQINTEDLQKYINQNKLYYFHTYNSYDIIKDIYVLIFVYNKDTNSFNIGILSEPDYNISIKKSKVDFIDLTYRLNSNFEYWEPKYCSYNFEKFHCYQCYSSDIFDSKYESQEDLLNYAIKKNLYLLGKYKAEIITLTNAQSYQREFNKNYEERNKLLIEDIKKELEEKKSVAEIQVKSESDKITLLREQLNDLQNSK